MNSSTFFPTIILLHIHCNTQPNLDVPSYIIILNLYHFLYHQKAVLLWKLLILTRCSSCRRAMGQCCSRGRPAKDEKKTGEEEDGGQGEGRRRRTEGWANIFAHPYFFKELGFLCIYNFTNIFLQHYLHKEQTFFASTFLQRFSRIYIFTRIYNFSCICIFTRSKDFYLMSKKRTFLVKLCMKYVIASWVLLMPQIPPTIVLSLEIHNSLSRKVNWQSQYDPRLKFTQPTVF